jgi:hypothetical protein
MGTDRILSRVTFDKKVSCVARRSEKVMASRDVDPVWRPDRISNYLFPIMNPPVNVA